MDFIDFFNDEVPGIRHFSASELLTLGASNAWLQCNTEPPEELWPNIVQTVKMADEIRHKFGGALRVLSAYRNSEYNRKVGGASQSQHLFFRAMDLEPLNGEIEKLHRVAKVVRDRFGFGGVGLYRWGVHIDSRNWIANW